VKCTVPLGVGRQEDIARGGRAPRDDRLNLTASFRSQHTSAYLECDTTHGGVLEPPLWRRPGNAMQADSSA
jgi:hypothetical protein